MLREATESNLVSEDPAECFLGIRHNSSQFSDRIRARPLSNLHVSNVTRSIIGQRFPWSQETRKTNVRKVYKKSLTLKKTALGIKKRKARCTCAVADSQRSIIFQF